MIRHRAFTSALLALLMAAFGMAGFVINASAQVDNPCQSNNTAKGGASTSTSDDDCSNSGDAEISADQNGSASSGDGVAGQVAGVVSAGDASVDATNRSDDVSVQTGDATGLNQVSGAAIAGVAHNDTVTNLCQSNNTSTNAGDLASSSNNCSNSGDADASADQAADAASGDGVGGQVIGVVTSAGGTADLVLDNESTDSNVDTGNAEFTNIDPLFAVTVVAGNPLGGGT